MMNLPLNVDFSGKVVVSPVQAVSCAAIWPVLTPRLAQRSLPWT